MNFYNRKKLEEIAFVICADLDCLEVYPEIDLIDLDNNDNFDMFGNLTGKARKELQSRIEKLAGIGGEK